MAFVRQRKCAQFSWRLNVVAGLGPRPTPPDRPVGWVRLVDRYGRALGALAEGRGDTTPQLTRARIIRALQSNCSNSAIIANWGMSDRRAE
jgi:hypothetical protein